MKEIQNSILAFAQENKYFSKLIKFDVVLAIIYPIYILLAKVIFLNIVFQYLGMISALFYIGYFVGTILCFAENKLIPLDIAFGGMAISYLFNLRYGISFNRLLYIVFYGAILGVCLVETRKSLQWNKFKVSAFSKVADVADAMGERINEKGREQCFCPNCGAKLDKKMRFCNNCGNQIMREE